MSISEFDENRALKCENRILWVALSAVAIMMLVMMFISMTASANTLDEIADGVNDALFSGQNMYATQTVLTASIMMGCGILLGVLKLPMIPIFVILFCVLGALTAIGWADITFILVSGLITVALFGSKLVNWVTGGERESEI